jgi:hypothetical protein
MSKPVNRQNRQTDKQTEQTDRRTDRQTEQKDKVDSLSSLSKQEQNKHARAHLTCTHAIRNARRVQRLRNEGSWDAYRDQAVAVDTRQTRTRVGHAHADRRSLAGRH